jgi:hypothetical protein
MKHLLTLLTILPLFLTAQNISVASFKSVPDDMTARAIAPVQDNNGEKCALIKMRTTEKGFVFEGDMLGIAKTEQKTGEVWVYVPYGAKKITIKHQQLGVLDSYIYPEAIKEATVYIMELTTGKVTTIVEDYEVPTQWVVITSEPDGANIFINDEHKGTTPFQQEMTEGKYNYRLEYPMYHNLAGIFNLVAADGKLTKEVKLKANFGKIKVSSSPEKGAKVLLDNKPTGKTTPCTLEQIMSGEHTISLQQEWYQPQSKKITVSDEQQTHVDITMKPSFANVKVGAENNAAIYIDGEYKAQASWEGRLIAGYHTFEAKKEKYHDDKTKQEIIAGEPKQITLSPKAKLGKVKLITNPFDADIRINGEHYGKTPLTVDKLLIGNYTVELTKMGYLTHKETITIEENKTVELTTTLKKGMAIQFYTRPEGAAVLINGKAMGVTPCTIALDAGTYTVQYQKENYHTLEKQITVSAYKNSFKETLTGKSLILQVETTPKKATLSLDNKAYGYTGTSFNATAGEYTLKLTRKGFKPYEQQVDVSKQQHYSFNLQPEQHRSKGKAILFSAFIPGYGQNYLNRGKGGALLLAPLTYGLGFAAFHQYNAAVTSYNDYKTAEEVSERNEHINNAKLQYKNSQLLMYAAAGTWLANMVWVTLIPSDNKRFKNTKPTIGYNPESGIMSYGLIGIE